MKERFKNFIEKIKIKKVGVLIFLVVFIIVAIASGVSAYYIANKNESMKATEGESVTNKSNEVEDSIVAIVGKEDFSIIGNTKSNNSWAGEIISLNNLQVQPDREGTISEWYVGIGEKVRAGQSIGKLSRPPQTPDIIMSLSEKAQMLSEARTNAQAVQDYTIKRIEQLKNLRLATENSNQQKIKLLGDTGILNEQKIDVLGSENNIDQSLSLITSKERLTQAILRGSIYQVLPIISSQTTIPKLGTIYNIQLKRTIGATDSSLRNKFPDVVFNVLSDLKDENIVPEKSGLAYFDFTIKLINSSISDGESISDASLESLKQMLIGDQNEFITALGEIKTMELEKINTREESIAVSTENVNTQRESIDTLAEIDAMIIELEKELSMLKGEVKAKETAYAIVNGSITGGYSILAPKSGIVSNIIKKPGEFVGPGMPVATVTAGGNDSVLVRMQIPSNTQKPKIGDLFSVVRPGFMTDIQEVRLVGVGSSLDDGSYMADAVFTEETQWSIGSSVRVLTPADSATMVIKQNSIVWSEAGTPSVWGVSEGGRIFKKEITIGRTLGDLVEVYTGLQNGDRYIFAPTADVIEDMFLEDLIKIIAPKASESSDSEMNGDDEEMGGMVM